MHALDAIHLSNALTGLAFAALGLWVLSVRAHAPVNLAFATYALAWAGGVFSGNLALEVGHDTPTLNAINVAMGVLVVVGLGVLVSLYPVPLGRRDALPAGVALVVGVLTLAWDEPVRGALAFDRGVLLALFFALFPVGYWIVLYFLALRWRNLEAAPRRAVVLICAALALWPAYTSGEGATLASDVVGLVGALAMPVGLAALWMWNTHAGGGRETRNAAWLVLGAAAVAMLERTAFPDALDLWGYGLSRLAGVAILAYAIVRHQLLGIDVKLRWGISKTTVAGAFIAVFFVASELAQQFFGETLGSSYVGILAAGALVFAIAPLSSLADRLAEKAVPVAGPASVDGSVDAYRRAVRLAMRGGITREEEHDLAFLADRLGVGAKRALEVREELERGRMR